MRAIEEERNAMRQSAFLHTGVDPLEPRGFTEQADSLGMDAVFSRLPAAPTPQVDFHAPDGTPYFAVDFHPVDSPDHVVG